MAIKKITQLTETITLSDNDVIPVMIDTTTTPKSRKTKWSTIKATLKTYFDTLYMNLVAPSTAGNILTSNGSAWVSSAPVSITKGRVEILAATVPTTVGAPIGQINGGSSPVEGFPYFSFVDGAITYRDFYCRLIGYSGGGLTLNFEVLRTSAASGLRYVFEAGIRRINTGTEDITTSHTYDYNSVTVTIPAGPPAAGIPMSGTITFTDGTDMDSLANNEAFILRFRRNATTANDDATDTARVLASITVRET